MGINFYAMCLHHISDNFYRSEQLKSLLAPISDAINKASYHIDSVIAADGKDEKYIEAVIGKETDMIEELLGVAFVVCQCYITEIISSFMKLHKLAEKDKFSLKTTKGNRSTLLEIGSGKVTNSKYTEIQTINAFANYYKHRDEWPVEWNKVNKQSKLTVEIISLVGAQQGCTGNMRRGATALGCSSYNNMDSLIDKIVKWRDNLVAKYSTELKKLKIL